MAAGEYGKWIKVANDLGLGGDELKMFVKERQDEAKLEKAKADEAEREARKMELKGKRLLAEAKKLEFEEKKQIAEREAESRRIAAEQEMKKLEFEARKQEMESQQMIRLKEMEFRLAQEQGMQKDKILLDKVIPDRIIEEISEIFRCRPMISPRIDSYLHRFELKCNTLKIGKDLWVLALIKSLKGQALEVHERMKAENAHDYQKLKVELLERFRLTEGGYRKKFKGAVREKDETTMQFGERFARYLDKWLQMSGFEENYAGLRALIGRDQFFIKC